MLVYPVHRYFSSIHAPNIDFLNSTVQYHHLHDNMKEHSDISWIWFKHPSGKEPIGGICKEKYAAHYTQRLDADAKASQE